MLATVSAVEQLGGTLFLREATGLRFEGGHVVGVEYHGGQVATERVVLAGGAWVSARRGVDSLPNTREAITR